MKAWRQILKGAAGFWGLVPGIVVMVGGLVTPSGQKIFFGATVETFGVLSVLILYSLRQYIRPKPIKYKLWAIGVCLVIFFSSLFTYSQLYAYTNITYIYQGKTHITYVPIWPNTKLNKRIQKEGNRKAVGMKYGPVSLDEQITKAARARTTYVLLIFFLLIFTSIPVAFCFAATLIEKESETNSSDLEFPVLPS